MKATSLFGGVQVFNIVISILRSKFIALLLGPTGMGIAGLLTSTTGMIAGLSSFGLGTSAIKDVSSAYASGNQEQLAKVVAVINRLMLLTGLLGTILTLFLAPWLSLITFNNYNYTIAFIWLSITLLLGQLNSGKLVLLQGMRKLQFLARANIYGSFFALVTTLPLYYFWGIRGIVPAIIIASSVSLLLSGYFTHKLRITNIQISFSDTLLASKKMVSMGFMLSLSGIITLASSYIVKIYVGRVGGINEVGLYTAGFAIINTYVGLVFSAMGTDFFPRLSAVAESNSKCRQVINQQAEISILIIAPIIMVFLVFINWIVILLYSKQFLGSIEMLQWSALGMLFKAASWAISFIFLAKGTSKLFFFSELIANIYIFVITILGYYLFGLSGLGLSFLLGYVLYFFQVFYIAKLNFDFFLHKEFIKIFSIQVLLAIVCFLSIFFLHKPSSFYVGLIIILFSSFYSIIQLDKRLDLRSIYKSFISKKT